MEELYLARSSRDPACRLNAPVKQKVPLGRLLEELDMFSHKVFPLELLGKSIYLFRSD